MKVYLAGNNGIDKIERKIGLNYYRLDTFYSIPKDKGIFLNKYKSFLLDSGAYSFLNKKEVVSWDSYIEKYANFINKYDVNLFFELDIDDIVGLKEVERLRAKLEKLTNKKCIPVWHKSRGKEYWMQMIKKYNYVAIGGFAIKEIKPKQYHYITWFLNKAREENCKVHGLGFTGMNGLIKYPFYSVDSSSWTYGNQFGYVYLFENGKLLIKKKGKNYRAKTKTLAEHNFKEWIKFQKYAQKNL